MIKLYNHVCGSDAAKSTVAAPWNIQQSKNSLSLRVEKWGGSALQGQKACTDKEKIKETEHGNAGVEVVQLKKGCYIFMIKWTTNYLWGKKGFCVHF